MVKNKQLKEFLVDAGLVSGLDIELAEKKAQKKQIDFGDVLVSEGYLSEDDFRRSEAYIFGIPFINLKNEKIDIDILSLIPEPIARKYNIVAYKKTATSLEVAMLDTSNLGAIELIKKKVGLKVLPRLTDKNSIKKVLQQYRKSLEVEFDNIIQKEALSMKTISEDDGEDRKSTV